MCSRKNAHEINNQLQIILAYSEKMDPKRCQAVKKAVMKIRDLVNETPEEKIIQEFEELLNKAL